MRCRIRTDETTFVFADGTLAGGVALTNLRLSFGRVVETVIPIVTDTLIPDQTYPVLYDRGIRKTAFDFVVIRVHDTINDAEEYVLQHDDDIPNTGELTLFSQDGSTVAKSTSNAAVFSRLLSKELGATTIHSYHIECGPLIVTGPTPPEADILDETGQHILTEDEQKIKVE